MKRAFFHLLSATIALAASAVTILPLHAQSKIAAPAVCPKPGAACNRFYKTFALYELPFCLPRTLAANTPVRSAPFHAIVLKRFTAQWATECDGGEWTTSVEQERRRFQKLLPKRKVFANYQCPDMGAVSYLVNGKPDNTVFIAVYAGQTEREAQRLKLRTKKVALQGQIHRMSVSFERIVQ